MEGRGFKGERGGKSKVNRNVIKFVSFKLLLSFLHSERRMKPLLPRTDSYLVPIQLPVTSSVYLPSSSAPFPPSCSQQKRNTSRGAKRVRIAPKVTTWLRSWSITFQKYILDFFTIKNHDRIVKCTVVCLTGDTKWRSSRGDVSSEEQRSPAEGRAGMCSN